VYAEKLEEKYGKFSENMAKWVPSETNCKLYVITMRIKVRYEAK